MLSKWQRPTLETKFHIDMDWWRENKRDIRIYIRELLCEDCRADYGSYQSEEQIDWIDAATGEVTRVDGLWHCLRNHCSQKPDYIAPGTPIIDAVFRTFLANGNKPLSVNELYEILDRHPRQTFLRILTAGQVYMGIRPAH